MKLHENTQRELLITTKDKRIIVETKNDLIQKKLRKQQQDFLIERLIFIFLGIALGCCLMYNFLTN